MAKESDEQKLARLEKAGQELKNKGEGGAAKAAAGKTNGKASKGAKAALKKQQRKIAQKEKKEAAKKKKAEDKEKKKAEKAARKAKKADERAAKKKEREEARAAKKAEREKEKAAKKAAKEEAKKKELEMRDKPVMALAKSPDLGAITEAKKFVKFTESSLVIDKDIPFEQWENVGRMLLGIEERWQFYIGDWIRFGKTKYGEKYAQAVNVLSKGYSTLANAVMVCEKFDASARKANLDFSIYLTLARVPDDKARLALLDQAAKEGWTVKEAREKSQKYLPKVRKGRGVPTSRNAGADVNVTLSVELQAEYDAALIKADEVLTFMRSRTFGKLPASQKNAFGKVIAVIDKLYKELY